MPFRNIFSYFALAGAQLLALFRSNQLHPSPLVRRLRRYSRGGFLDDFRAGTNVALMAFPQGMAYALIAGLPIEYGILCSVGASLLGPFFGGSRFNSYGSTNASAVLVLSIFSVLNLPQEEMLRTVPLLVFMAGCFLIIGAFANVAKLIQYVSKTVITSYITAAALQIIVNQIKNVLGVSIPKSPSLVTIFWDTLQQVSNTHLASVALALATYALFWGFNKYTPKLPTVAVVIIATGGIAAVMNLYGLEVATLSSLELSAWQFGAIPFDLDLVNQLASPALALAFLIALESSSIGKSLAARAGDRINLNQEMLGLGFANIGSALFGGMAASASLTRSMLNFKSGAFSAMSNVFSALIVGILLVGLSQFIQYIPVPSLAVVVITIGVSLINKHQILIVSKSTRSDAIVFFVTLATGLFLALDTAIYLGTATAIVLFLRKVAEPELIEYSFNEQGQLTELSDTAARPNPEVSIVHVEGELFFGASEVFYNQIRRIFEDPNLKVLVLKLRNAHRLDASAVLALEELIMLMRENNRHLIISEARKETIRIFKNSKMIDLIGRDNIFPDRAENPTYSTARALKRAVTLLEGKQAKVSIYVDDKKHE